MKVKMDRSHGYWRPSCYSDMAMETLMLKCQPQMEKVTEFKTISCIYLCKSLQKR